MRTWRNKIVEKNLAREKLIFEDLKELVSKAEIQQTQREKEIFDLAFFRVKYNRLPWFWSPGKYAPAPSPNPSPV